MIQYQYVRFVVVNNKINHVHMKYTGFIDSDPFVFFRRFSKKEVVKAANFSKILQNSIRFMAVYNLRYRTMAENINSLKIQLIHMVLYFYC